MPENIGESALWAFVVMGGVFFYHAYLAQKAAERPSPYRSEDPSDEESPDEMLAHWTLAAAHGLRMAVYWVGGVMSFGIAAILWKLT